MEKNSSNPSAIADRDGLAVIGQTLHALRGLRFNNGEGGAGAGGGDNGGNGGDPAAGGEPNNPAAPAADNKPPANNEPPANETPEQMVARLQADVQRLEREKQDARVKKEGELKKNAQKKQLLAMAEVVGVKVEDPDSETLESLQEKLTGKVLQGDQQTERVQQELKQAKIDLAVYRTAALADVRLDPSKLNDRLSFHKAVAELDPNDSDFETKLKAAMLKVAENDPTVRVSGGTGKSGADQYGGAGGDQITQEAFNKMGVAERTALLRSNPALYERLAS